MLPESSGQILVQNLTNQLDNGRIEEIVTVQRNALARFEKTNEMLSNCCNLSASRLEMAKRELNWNTQLITDMKKDLDSVFRRIRVFKNSMMQLYPESFQPSAAPSIPSTSSQAEEEMSEEQEQETATASRSGKSTEEENKKNQKQSKTPESDSTKETKTS